MVRKIFGGKKCRKSAYPQISKKTLAAFAGFEDAEKLVFVVIENLDDDEVDIFPAATVAGTGKYLNLSSGEIAPYGAKQNVFAVQKMNLNSKEMEVFFSSSAKTSVSVKQLKRVFGKDVIC